MTNFEKWKDEIATIRSGGHCVAVVNGEPVKCISFCNSCDFKSVPCVDKLIDWLLAEYQEPAPKLTRQEREFLECFEFKYDKAISKTAGRTYLRMAVSEHEIHSEEINSDMFPFIKPGKQWTFEDLLKLEVEE